MKSAMPKPLHPLAHKPMLGYVVDAYKATGAKEIVIVIAPDDTKTPELFPDCTMVVQKEQKGTGHAAQTGFNALTKKVDKVIIALGDQPFVQAETIEKTVAQKDAVTIIAMRPNDPARYGRLVTNERGGLLRIVEYKDASETERAIDLCNAYPIAIDHAKASELLNAIDDKNAAKEYYLTDIVTLANARNYACGFLEAHEMEAAAANTREELAGLEKILQEKLRRQHMLNGVTLVDPSSVYFAHDTIIGQDVVIEPNVFFGPNVKIANNVHIKAFSHIEGAVIGEQAQVGPFARLRPGTELSEKTKIGNFVETKKAKIGAGTKVNHLAYVGDAIIGSKTNIGAGSIFCNYDGYDKFQTIVGDNVMIGSNSTIISPITIENNTMTAGGSVITQNVPENALAVGRGKQVNIGGWMTKFRARKQKEKK